MRTTMHHQAMPSSTDLLFSATSRFVRSAGPQREVVINVPRDADRADVADV